MKATTKKVYVSWIAIGVVATASIGCIVMAQGGPGGFRGQGGPGGGQGGPGMMMPQPPPVTLKAGTDGVFVLAGDSLIKFDASLHQLGTVKILPKDTGKGAADNSGNQPPRPPRPAAMLIAPTSDGASAKVIVIAGDDFISIDAVKLTVAAKATLPAIKAPDKAKQNGPAPGGPGFNGPDGNGGMPPMQMGPPPGQGSLELGGRVLYIVRADQIVGVNVDDGKLVGQASLPKPPQPGNDK